MGARRPSGGAPASRRWWDPRTWWRSPRLALPSPEGPSSVREYEAASTARRFSDWSSGNAFSANAEVAKGARALRERSRDLVRNNAYAAAAIRALTSNIVGEGISPRCTTVNPELARQVDELWAKWAPFALVSLPLGIYGLQTLAVRSWLESGEVFVRRRLVESRASRIPLRLQVLECDQLDTSITGPLEAAVKGGLLPGVRVVQGIELDETETVLAYRFWRTHPGDRVATIQRDEVIRVEAGEVAHLFEPGRPGQIRGVPWLTPGMRRFRELDSYEDAELMRKRVEACVSAFVYSDEPEEEGITAKVVDSAGAIIETMEPGTIGYLRGGKKIEFNAPTSVGGYDSFKRAELQSIAAAVGLTYELLSGDLSRVNFSSIRAGLIEFRRLVRSLRTNLVVPMLCDPIWRWFIEAAVAAGELPLPPGARIEELYPVRWSPPRFEEVDREKDAAADLAELQAGTTTLPDVLARRGLDWLSVLDEHARVKEEVEARGLSFTSLPYVAGVALGAVRPVPPEVAPPPPDAAE